MLSGNEYRLHLNSCSSSCSPHILLFMSLIDPCNVYFQGDILFCSAGSKFCSSRVVEILVATQLMVLYMIFKHVMAW